MSDIIPAILILNKNKTYGRTPNGRLLYKAVPYNGTDHVLVPYNIKPSFSKAYTNLYVLLKNAEIAETIGPVDKPENTYTYELHCKGLWLSHPVAFKRPRTLPTFFLEAALVTTPKIFTIDGPTTKDFDDAFSIRPGIDKGPAELTIYISNVPIILAHMGLLTDLVAGTKMSSIYLPDRVVPMMPARFSEGLCSLQAGTGARPCFTLTFYISQTGAIINTAFDIQPVSISHNYVYDTDELHAAPEYKSLLETTRAVFTRAAFSIGDPRGTQTFNFTSCPQTSADVVAYWMLMMNWVAAYTAASNTLSPYRPIYRAGRTVERNGEAATAVDITAPRHLLSPEIEKAIARKYADYIVGEYTTTPSPHDTLGVSAYMHVTSPIRRMPDVINITIIMLSHEHITYKLGATIHEHLRHALDIFQVARENYCDRLNTQMRAIKQVQQQCDLLAAASTITDGVRPHYDAILCAPCDTSAEWEIYIPQLRLFSRAKIPMGYDPRAYDKITCELYALHDALTTRRLVHVNLYPTAHN